MTTSNGYMGRDAFAAASKRRFKDVELADGNKCRIRSMTEGEYTAIDIKSLGPKGAFSVASHRYFDARLVAFCTVDHDGNPIFGDSQADLDAIMAIDAGILFLLIREIRLHCGLTVGVEDAEKNSDSTADAGLQSS